MKNTKRILALVLTLCMVIPMCLFQVSAAEAPFDPISGESHIQNLVTTAEHYRAHIGVNPANGHDLAYIMFKGKDMVVYDIDAKEVYDIEINTINEQQKGSCIDGNGNLWVCGAGDEIYKYDPTLKCVIMYEMDWTALGVPRAQESYGITYGDDGWLYFGYLHGYLIRFDPINCVFERLGDRVHNDVRFTGHGGVVYKDGFLYTATYGDANADGKVTSELIKFDIAKREVVQRIDILNATKAGATQYKYGIRDLNLMDGILYGTQSFRPNIPLYVDITGDEMVWLNQAANLDQYLTHRFVGPTTDGKYYMAGGGKNLYEYDPATDTFAQHPGTSFAGLNTHGGIVTVEGDDRLPGQSLVNVVSNTTTGKVDLYFYNLQTRKTVRWSGVNGGFGAAARLEDFEMDPTGRYIFSGGYGNNSVGVYDTQTGESKQYPTMDHQIDSMLWYDGCLWLGVYENAHIVRFDFNGETTEAKKISALYNTVFRQRRMLNPTAGDGKVFFAGEPDAYMYGGVLAWYDIEKDLTFVAAGPNPEDVYYARTTASFAGWRNAETNKIADLNTSDVRVDGEQRFNGVVYRQVLCSLNYVDGYIIGATTTQNGKSIAAYGNPQLFAYDVNAMKLVATHDITETLQDFDFGGVSGLVDAFRADPYQKGKFWGVVGNTLFSATYNFDTDTFNVKEELTFDEGYSYKYHKSHMSIDIRFDGDFMYVCTQQAGTYMVNTSDPSVYYQISYTPVSDLMLAPNGDLLYLSKRDSLMDDVRIFRCAEFTQPLVIQSVQSAINNLPESMNADNEAKFMAAYNMYNNLIESSKPQVDADKLLAAISEYAQTNAANADALINAIGEVTLQSEAAIQAARWYYDSLSAEAKNKVTQLAVLEAAEAAFTAMKVNELLPDRNTDTGTDPGDGNGTGNAGNAGSENGEKSGGNAWLFVGIGAAVVIAAAVVVLVLLKKKKVTASNSEEATEEKTEE